ncbi:DNA polymerase IV [Deinococcus psychrotolerans]|uniref:DNA polymerase IV n=2 Tax=Deinococcus psychrotolerans TaxID=2489213 RepID=A0A3G8YGK8_9DEIO|nr:DNA polymerase IV [Deinococcus psychrotolerans]
MDAFYASVEVRDQPKLIGLAVAVAHQSKRGVVLTASYEARQYGVRSAMPTSLALQKCPHLTLVPPRMDVYKQVSDVIRAVFFQYTDLVEPLSLDEAYLDVSQHPSGTLIARAIKADIQREARLTASAGVSFNKFLAKLASDMHKPDGLTVIRPEQADALIAALPVEAFHGVGPATKSRMHDRRLFTGADLKRQSLSDLTHWFGAQGAHFHRISHGIDERPVDPDRERKSVGVERTFEDDLSVFAEAQAALPGLVELLMPRLTRADYHGRSLVLKIKFADRTVLTRRVTSAAPLLDAAKVLTLAYELLTPELLAGRAVRLLGLSVQNQLVAPISGAQLPLFPRGLDTLSRDQPLVK